MPRAIRLGHRQMIDRYGTLLKGTKLSPDGSIGAASFKPLIDAEPLLIGAFTRLRRPKFGNLRLIIDLLLVLQSKGVVKKDAVYENMCTEHPKS
jgi:hypothetical protein